MADLTAHVAGEWLRKKYPKALMELPLPPLYILFDRRLTYRVRLHIQERHRYAVRRILHGKPVDASHLEYREWAIDYEARTGCNSRLSVLSCPR